MQPCLRTNSVQHIIDALLRETELPATTFQSLILVLNLLILPGSFSVAEFKGCHHDSALFGTSPMLNILNR